MTAYRRQVAAALGAVRIRGDTRYAWLGRASRVLPETVRAELDEDERRSYLVACIREELYASFYCHGSPVPARWGEPQPVAGDPWLLGVLSDANGGAGTWDDGWTITRLDGDEAVVTSGRLRARVPAGECRGPLQPGATVQLAVPKELPALSPGFYTVVSDAAAVPGAVVRVYWSVTRASAPELVRKLTTRLNTDQVPFRLKVADHPARLDRCDAAVLYLPHALFGAVRATLREVACSIRLRPRMPAFTLELASGAGLAEDDGAGDSFGVSRCALLADGIVRAHERGVGGPAAFDFVAERFADAGVDLDAPYREPSLAGRHVL
jgi:hypothetical protein